MDVATGDSCNQSCNISNHILHRSNNVDLSLYYCSNIVQAKRLLAHVETISVIKFAPGGEFFVTASRGPQARIKFWGTEKLELRATITSFTTSAESMEFSLDSQYLAWATESTLRYVKLNHSNGGIPYPDSHKCLACWKRCEHVPSVLWAEDNTLGCANGHSVLFVSHNLTRLFTYDTHVEPYLISFSGSHIFAVAHKKGISISAFEHTAATVGSGNATVKPRARDLVHVRCQATQRSMIEKIEFQERGGRGQFWTLFAKTTHGLPLCVRLANNNVSVTGGISSHIVLRRPHEATFSAGFHTCEPLPSKRPLIIKPLNLHSPLSCATDLSKSGIINVLVCKKVGAKRHTWGSQWDMSGTSVNCKYLGDIPGDTVGMSTHPLWNNIISLKRWSSEYDHCLEHWDLGRGIKVASINVRRAHTQSFGLSHPPVYSPDGSSIITSDDIGTLAFCTVKDTRLQSASKSQQFFTDEWRFSSEDFSVIVPTPQGDFQPQQNMVYQEVKECIATPSSMSDTETTLLAVMSNPQIEEFDADIFANLLVLNASVQDDQISVSTHQVDAIETVEATGDTNTATDTTTDDSDEESSVSESSSSSSISSTTTESDPCFLIPFSDGEDSSVSSATTAFGGLVAPSQRISSSVSPVPTFPCDSADPKPAPIRSRRRHLQQFQTFTVEIEESQQSSLRKLDQTESSDNRIKKKRASLRRIVRRKKQSSSSNSSSSPSSQLKTTKGRRGRNAKKQSSSSASSSSSVPSPKKSKIKRKRSSCSSADSSSSSAADSSSCENNKLNGSLSVNSSSCSSSSADDSVSAPKQKPKRGRPRKAKSPTVSSTEDSLSSISSSDSGTEMSTTSTTDKIKTATVSSSDSSESEVTKTVEVKKKRGRPRKVKSPTATTSVEESSVSSDEVAEVVKVKRNRTQKVTSPITSTVEFSEGEQSNSEENCSTKAESSTASDDEENDSEASAAESDSDTEIRIKRIHSPSIDSDSCSDQQDTKRQKCQSVANSENSVEISSVEVSSVEISSITTTTTTTTTSSSTSSITDSISSVASPNKRPVRRKGRNKTSSTTSDQESITSPPLKVKRRLSVSSSDYLDRRPKNSSSSSSSSFERGSEESSELSLTEAILLLAATPPKGRRRKKGPTPSLPDIRTEKKPFPMRGTR